MNAQHTPGPFVVCGKSDNTMYSVRTERGEAIATCAYNTSFSDRYEWARLVVEALNAYGPAIAKATGSAS